MSANKTVVSEMLLTTGPAPGRSKAPLPNCGNTPATNRDEAALEEVVQALSHWRAYLIRETIRRADSSFHPQRNDFQIGPFQIPINEMGNHQNFQTAVDRAIKAIQELH